MRPPHAENTVLRSSVHQFIITHEINGGTFKTYKPVTEMIPYDLLEDK